MNKQPNKISLKIGKGRWKRTFIAEATASGYPEETNEMWSSDTENEVSCHRESCVSVSQGYVALFNR
jgi:hypothetical protein